LVLTTSRRVEFETVTNGKWKMRNGKCFVSCNRI
jgi:hypothetical protein